jgi:hypothetical protein
VKEGHEQDILKYHDQIPKHNGKREAVTRESHPVLNDVSEKMA